MMKRFLIFLSFIFLFSGVASALEFSADTVMTTKGHKTTGKIFFSKDKMRMDMVSPQNMSMITRIDKKVAWKIMPKEKTYMEIPLNMKNKPMVEEKMQGEMERKLVGAETIDGHPAKKYLITYKSDNAQEQVYQWMATDINFPVKTAAVDGSWTQEYKNIKFGSQPGSLFEVPAGYKKFQMPGGMNFNRPNR
jgi:outer membrane lipoprotein-sorting protein